jgi:hypothetical protein
MGASLFPAPVAGAKTRRKITLTSGTSWTVPAGVEFVIATLIGGGGGGGRSGGSTATQGTPGNAGQIRTSFVATTPGSNITYSIGAGGNGGTNVPENLEATAGGTTTFTGATSASGGSRGSTSGNTPLAQTQVPGFNNGGEPGHASTGSVVPGGAGGSGIIFLEYWI